MSVMSVPAIYDGEHIRLLEKAPVERPYRVLVTFVEPAPDLAPQDLVRFWASFGAWKDHRPVEETLRTIHEARCSSAEPPNLRHTFSTPIPAYSGCAAGSQCASAYEPLAQKP